MGRKSLKETRQKEILEVFYDLAVKEGLENTSIAKIAKAMDVNPSLIIHYFQTKEDLVYGLIDFILNKYLLIFKVSKKDETDPRLRLLKVIDNLFSKKWNILFDDGLSYSCYSLSFRDAKVKAQYKTLLDSLHGALADLIRECKSDKLLEVEDERFTADLIFVIVDGAYYYLSLVSDKVEYARKLEMYKKQAHQLLSWKVSYDFA